MWVLIIEIGNSGDPVSDNWVTDDGVGHRCIGDWRESPSSGGSVGRYEFNTYSQP